MSFTPDDLSHDGFLDGRLKIWQPLHGYRAATDPVFLAAAVPARAGQSVLELGCGAGVASLCLGRRVAGLSIAGVEIQPDYAELAARNARENGLELEVVCGDIEKLPAGLRDRSFDHVIANPPYFKRDAGTPAHDQGKDAAFREATPLAIWIDTAMRRLKPKGVLTLVHLAERLPQILAGLDGRAGDISVKPLAARAGRPAGRMILQARKGGRGPFQLCAPLILHDGGAHDGDRDSSSAPAKAILRDGAMLEL